MHNFWPLDVSLIVTRIFNVSAEGASEKFRAFYRGTTYDVIIFKFQGGHSPPCPPLLTPMLSDAPLKFYYGLNYMTSLVQLISDSG